MLIPQKSARYSAATTGTLVVNRPGGLNRVIITAQDVTAIVTLYDGTSTAGTPLLSACCAVDQTQCLNLHGLTFNTGLFIVLVGGSFDAFVHYE